MQVDSSLELGRDDPALEFPWASDDGRVRYYDLRNHPALIEQLPEARDFCELRDFLVRVNAAEFPLQTAKSDIWLSDEMSPEEEVFASALKLVSYVDLIFSAPAPRLSLGSHLNLIAKVCALLQRAPEMPATIDFVVRHCYYHADENPEVRHCYYRPDENPDAWQTTSPAPITADAHMTADPHMTHDSRINADADMTHDAHITADAHITPDAHMTADPHMTHDARINADANMTDGSHITDDAHITAEARDPDVLLSLTHEPGADVLCGSRVGFCITAYVSGFADTEAGARQRWAIALKLLQHALIQAVCN